MSTPPPVEPSLIGWIDQSPTLATIVGGLVLAGILYGLSFVPKLKPAYRVVGRGIARFFKWIWSWRVNGKVKRDALVQQGYDKRDAEVLSERAMSPRPSWLLKEQKEGLYYLTNMGWAVSDVELEVDPEYFTFETSRFFNGKFGDDTPGTGRGGNFEGAPTPRGRREGVTFHITWTDRHGDRQPETSGGTLPGSVSLPPEAPTAVIQPTWQVGRAKGKDPRIHLLLDHTHDKSVVKNVKLECDPVFFTFMGQHEWDGELFGEGRLFPGQPTEYGHNLGVTFEVTYDDVNGNRQRDVVHLPEGKGLYGYPGF